MPQVLQQVLIVLAELAHTAATQGGNITSTSGIVNQLLDQFQDVIAGDAPGGDLTARLRAASDLFAAGVDIHGVHNWNITIQNFTPSYNPEARPDYARVAFESSPMADVDTWSSPVLLISGDDDRNVPFRESVDLAQKLRERGVHVEQLVFPDEIHGFLLHSSWVTLFEAAGDHYGLGVLGPGGLVSDPIDAISLGLALMFGTAGLPHILMRFYTVPDARTARTSVSYATAIIGVFYLLTFILGFGAMVIVGQDTIRDVDTGGNMAALLLASALGGPGFMGFISAVAFATILAVVAGLTLAGAAALSHDLWVNVVRGGSASDQEQLRVARVASALLGVLAIVLGIVFEGQNVAYMVGLAFAIAASANFPALLLSIFWRGFTTRGAQASMFTGTVVSLVLIYLSPAIQMDVLGHASAIFPLRNPGIISIPLAFLVAFVVSVVWPEPEAASGFAKLERRVHLGADE